MRHHHGLVRISIALLCAISTSATTIAQEALPVVQPKRAAAEVAMQVADASLLPPAPTVDLLPAEPLRDYEREPMTLAEAARANDYAAFDAAYRRANDAAYAELHALWTFSVSDPIGGFYGDAMHDRLARAYPRYAAHIEDFQIVDRNGNVFYPSAETRAFLTEQAIAGVLPVAGSRFSVFEPKRESVKVASKPQPKPAPVAKPAPVVQAAPAQPAIPVAQQAARATSNEQRTTSTPAPPAPAPRVAQTSSTARGLLLIIIGLLGIGALTMMLRTPAEDLPPADTVQPPAVPFTKAGGEPPAEPRATGSHG